MGTPTVKHPSAEELTRLAAGEAVPPATSAHLLACTACAAELDALRTAVDALRLESTIQPPNPAACLSDHEIAALAEPGAGPPEPRQVEHLAECGRCRATVSSVRRALASSDVAREAGALDRGERAASWRRYVLPVVVAASVVLLLVGEPASPPPDVHREQPITVAPAPRVIAPLGLTTETGVLRWHAVIGADRYRVTLFDADGGVLHEASVTDTILAVPADVDITTGSTYNWIVAARTGLDRWVTSDLAEFSVSGGTRR